MTSLGTEPLAVDRAKDLDHSDLDFATIGPGGDLFETASRQLRRVVPFD